MNILLAHGDRIEGKEIIVIEGKNIDMVENKPTLLLIPKGSISKTDKARMTHKGYLVIECADPEKVKTVADLQLIGPDDIAMAAIETLHHVNTGTTTKDRFAQNVLNKTMAKIINQIV